VLQALATRYRVSLLIIPLYDAPSDEVPAAIAEVCKQIVVQATPFAEAEPMTWTERLRHWLRIDHPAVRTLGMASRLEDAPFDIVHVFRLATLPLAARYLQKAPGRRSARHRISTTSSRRRTLVWRRSIGRTERIRWLMPRRTRRRSTPRSRHEVLHDFDRVYVCSEADRAELQGRGRARNLRFAQHGGLPAPLPPANRADPFTFLFVGTLGYYPNTDAVHYFCTQVVPLLRERSPRAFQVTIVGIGAPASVQELARMPEVQVVGAVPDVTPWYRDAHAVVVPLRAGGGTRIKVLEAFSFRRPSREHVAGYGRLEARPEEHFLLGDHASRARRGLRPAHDRGVAG